MQQENWEFETHRCSPWLCNGAWVGARSSPTGSRLPSRRHPRPALAHGVAHRLSGGRRADSLPARLPPHRRPQPDPRQRPRAGRHAADRPQEPRHLRPLQHHPRAGTARRRGPARRVFGAAGAGAPRARAPGRSRRPSALCDAPPRKGAGTLGRTPITGGRLRGREITFSVGAAVFNGSVQGNTMSGSVTGGIGGVFSGTGP